MTVILIVVSGFGTIPKWLVKWLEDLEIALLRLAEYQEESWRHEETCCHSNPSEKPSSNIDVKALNRLNNYKVGNRSRGRLEGSPFNSYYTEV